jgi:Protein of unknown function (DUF3313)
MQSRSLGNRFQLKLTHLALAVTLAFGAGAFSAGALAADKLPEVSPEGLKLVPKTKASAVYLRDGADFSAYDKVAILECPVGFRQNWQQEQNSQGMGRVSDSDMAKIRAALSAEFLKVFTQQLTDKGQTVVTGGGTGVLILRPAIINLDIEAPNTTAPNALVFTDTAGQATLYLELYDGVSGDLLARIIDVEAAGDNMVGSRVRNQSSNRADADRMLNMWASRLGTYLESARASAPPAPASAPVAQPAAAPAADPAGNK